ncbi:YdcH family protein [Parapedomonas caeni]
MANTPHELHEEFPEFADRIHALKVGNPHFQKLMETYREVNRKIHRAEIEVEPMDDQALEHLKVMRLGLKDEMFSLLQAA